ncbi:TraQ conjugal transfer family protein [Tenacibaculum agarivorans]|uniref:TraQ conjugal transfer family protein n=1 Tax=Tenacibaculum agarivorans TaxID=1908389 RepID=UPI00094BBB15|nr:TraQ conjugal transfer family protein [Tenacibaculum agarivorans]
MKKLLKILFITLLGLVVDSCQKDFIVIDSFPFELQENHRENLTINVPEQTIFEVQPEKVVTTVIYEFQYSVDKGKGFYQREDGTRIPQNEWVVLKDLNFNYDFVGTESGEAKVTVFVKDKVRQEKLELTYLIRENPFTIDINAINGMATLNQAKPFTILLNNQGEDQSVTYTAKVFLSQGKGKIQVLNQDGEVVRTIDQQKTFELLPGTYNYQVTLEETGVNVISLEVTDSNGQKVETTQEFAVSVINFEFRGAPEKLSTTLGNDVLLNFTLFEPDGGNATYTLGYVIEEPEAEIFSGVNQITAGNDVDVSLGSFSWIFRPTKIGKPKFKFTAINSSGVKKDIVIEIEVKDRSFDFTATRSLATVDIGNSVDITYVTTEEGGTSPDNYTMTFESSSNGTMVVDGVEYNAGEVITVPSLNFKGTYKGLTKGTHKVTTHMVAQSNGLTVSKEVEIEYLGARFSLDVTTNNEITVGDTMDLDFVINELAGVSTFDISYSITGPDQEIKNASGATLSTNTDYDITDKTFSWSFKAIEPGRVKMTFNLVNQFGDTLPDPVEIEIIVKPVTFDFTVRPISTTFRTGEFSTFEISTNQLASGLTYQLRVDSAQNINMIYQGISRTKGAAFNFNTGLNRLGVASSTAGDNFIDFTLIASNGVEVTKTIDVDFYKIPTITAARYGSAGSGSIRNRNYSSKIEVNFDKDPSSRIVGYEINGVLVNNVNLTNTEFSFTNDTDCGSSSSLRFGCGYIRRINNNVFIDVVVIDNNGFKSRPFSVRVQRLFNGQIIN